MEKHFPFAVEFTRKEIFSILHSSSSFIVRTYQQNESENVFFYVHKFHTLHIAKECSVVLFAMLCIHEINLYESINERTRECTHEGGERAK